MSFPNDHSMNIIRLDTGEERNTMLNWHLYPADEHNTVPPEPKFIYEDTPGVDGNLDVSENTSDRILFNNRKGEWEFYVANRPLHQPNIDETQTWADIQSDISNFLHGQKCKVIFADDPNYYYIGRLSVTDFEPNKNYQHVTIEYDFEPYKYEHEAYDSGTRSVSGSSSLTAAGSPMPAIPTFTITSSKFAFHQHDELTRGEAIYMLYRLSAAVSSSGNPWPVTITESKFLDVSEDDYYYDAVLWAEEYGITSGISDKIFGGSNICTRAQFLTMLYAFNWMGSTPTKVSGNIPFTDVKINSYYYNPVKWAWNHDPQIVVGDGNGHFMPNEPMTRQHACAIIYKYRSEPSYSDTSDIIDLAGSETIAPWYYVAVVKLWNEGIIDGYADGTYKPANYITRGQFATMLYAAAGRPSVSGLTHPYTDVTSDMYCNSAVLYLYDIGVVSGTSETTFSPERAMLRKEMIQVLFQYGNYEARYNPNLDYFDPDGEEDNDDAVASGYEVATDVPQESYYFYAVAWGVMHDITTLNAGNMFYPDKKATRAMAAQMLYKLLKILNDWEDDTAAEIDGTRSYTKKEETEVLLEWQQGSVNLDGTFNSNDYVVASTQYIPITVAGLGTANKFAFVVPSGYSWIVYFFTAQNSLVSGYNSIWRTIPSGRNTQAVPDGANYVRYSLKKVGSGTRTEDYNLPSEYWRVGALGDDGKTVTTSTEQIYMNAYLRVSGVGLQKLVIYGASTAWKWAIFFYDRSGDLIDYWGNYDETSPTNREEILISDMPTGTTQVRFRLYKEPSQTLTTADSENLHIIGYLSGAELTPTEADNSGARAYRIVETTITDVGVTDIKKYTVNYSDAIKYCYDDEIVDEPMIERAPMDVTLENSKGTKTVTVPSGEDLVPELLVVDGENEFTVEGTGTYRIQFKRGSL